MQYANIEAERSRNGLSRAELSQRLGVSQTTYKRYVEGDSPIPSSTLIKLSGLFHCSVDYLLGLQVAKSS